ncbi:beta strand repeat-containing protein, partial [Azospirillum sp. sgz302134]
MEADFSGWTVPQSFLDAITAGERVAEEHAGARQELVKFLAEQGVTGDEATTVADGVLAKYLSALASGSSPEQAAEEARVAGVEHARQIEAPKDAAQTFEQALASGANVTEALSKVVGNAGATELAAAFAKATAAAPNGGSFASELQAAVAVAKALQDQSGVATSAAQQLIASLSLGGTAAAQAIEAAVAGLSPEQAVGFLANLQTTLASGSSAEAAVASAQQAAQAVAAAVAAGAVPVDAAGRLAAALATGGADAQAVVAAMTSAHGEAGASAFAEKMVQALASGSSPASAIQAAMQTASATSAAAAASSVPMSEGDRQIAGLAQGTSSAAGDSAPFVQALVTALASGQSSQLAMSEARAQSDAASRQQSDVSVPSNPLLAALASGQNANQAIRDMAATTGGDVRVFAAALSDALASGTSFTNAMEGARSNADAASTQLAQATGLPAPTQSASVSPPAPVVASDASPSYSSPTSLSPSTAAPSPSPAPAPAAAPTPTPPVSMTVAPTAPALAEMTSPVAATATATPTTPAPQTTTPTSSPEVTQARVEKAVNHLPEVAAARTVEVSARASKVSLGVAVPTDADGDTLTVTVTGVPGHGTLQTSDGSVVAVGRTLSLSDYASLSFVPAGGFAGDAGTLSVVVSDGRGGTAEAKTSILQTYQNTAPVASGMASLSPVAEDVTSTDGASVESLFAARFSDSADVVNGYAGERFVGVAVVGNMATAGQGVWQYSTGGGWAAVPTGAGEGAALLLDSSSRLRFIPAADWNGTPGSLTVRVAESGDSFASGSTVDLTGRVGGSSHFSAGTVTLSTQVLPVGDAPTTTDTGTTLARTAEDATSPAGATVASLFSSLFSDGRDAVAGGSSADSFGGVAITANAAGTLQGIWQYSTDGVRWTAVPSGLSDGSALVLDAAAQLRFLPSADWNGTPGALTARLYDSSATVVSGTTVSLSSAANASAFTATSVTLATSVTAVNDAPVASGSATLASVSEDATPAGATVASLFAANFSDVADAVSGGSNANVLAGIAVVGNAATAAQGVWQYSSDGGASWTAVSTTLSANAALLLSASTLLRFLPAADWNGAPGGLTVHLADGSTTLTTGATANLTATGGVSAYSVGTVTLATSVTAVNDAPVPSGDGALAGVAEDTASPAGATVAALVGGSFSDAADAVSGGSSADTLAG